MFTKKNETSPSKKSLDGIHIQIKKQKKDSFSFFSFSFFPKRKRTLFSSFLILSLFILSGFFFFSHNEKIKGATYGWIQSSWIGGITTNTANHTDNQENWTEFASKDDNIIVTPEGEVTISGTSDSWVETSDTDFTTGTNTKLYVSGTGTSADIKLLKPLGAMCSTNAECFDGNGTAGYGQGFCNAGFCTNPWISGPCSGIDVFKNDASGTRQWKTSDTACDTPQCGLDGGQNNDNLVANNSVDFSLYPARNVCKNIGGRLPTLSELQCIYTNRAVYDDYGAFVGNIYWSSTETSTANAYLVNFYNGNTHSNGKTNSTYVRCVRGQ